MRPRTFIFIELDGEYPNLAHATFARFYRADGNALDATEPSRIDTHVLTREADIVAMRKAMDRRGDAEEKREAAAAKQK